MLIVQKNASFGQRREPHTIIIARGQNVRHFSVRPWVLALCGCVFVAISIGYISATTYLVFRDDLINSALTRQARLQHAYEDRISTLRSQVDRITSHRLLDQQFMEGKIAELASRQNLLAARTGKLTPLLDRAQKTGLDAADSSAELPIPALRPGNENRKSAFLNAPEGALDTFVTGSIAAQDGASATPDGALAVVRDQISIIEAEQIDQIASLADAALAKRKSIIASANAAGIQIAARPVTGTGGPLLPASKDGAVTFERKLDHLSAALDALEVTRNAVKRFPIANPAPGYAISSNFGNRRDPIVGKTAFHAGMDFRTPTGTAIRAAGAGTVVKAGRNGGYGKMVEIKHADGFTTRYAHLSQITVKSGDRVAVGETIGAAGSTGRSTGPHLHYEVRRNGKPVNPATYMQAGKKLWTLL